MKYRVIVAVGRQNNKSLTISYTNALAESLQNVYKF